jgi:hypothetical protein
MSARMCFLRLESHIPSSVPYRIIDGRRNNILDIDVDMCLVRLDSLSDPICLVHNSFIEVNRANE